jgi:hypothetical protein
MDTSTHSFDGTGLPFKEETEEVPNTTLLEISQ